MDELKRLGAKIDALKNAGLLEQRACAEAIMSQLLRILTEMESRLNALEEKGRV